jgi:hypothetical protein
MRRKHVLLCKHQLGPYSDYLKLAFVRNPWDRLVSCFVQKIGSRDVDDPLSRGTASALAKAGLYAADITFRDFAHAVSRIPDEKADRHFRSQSSFLSDRRGALLADEIRRFEELKEGFEYLVGLLGRDDLELPHLKKTVRKDYREYYDDETVEVVRRRYARDVALFGYEF